MGLKAVAGGGLVVAFSLVSDRLKPKALAGLFSGAPSVALASLTDGMRPRSTSEERSSGRSH